jgi:hypothetical protein
MEVNLRGTLLSTQLVLPEMVGRRRGRIVNLSARARGVPVAACVSVLPRGRYARNDTAADRPRCADLARASPVSEVSFWSGVLSRRRAAHR